MEKIIKVNGQELKMVANALIPRKYRNTFGSDMILDMQELQEAYKKRINEGVNLPPKVLTTFENVAWLFAKEGGNDVGQNVDEWLEKMEMLSIYEVLPQILELWTYNNKTTSTPSGKK